MNTHVQSRLDQRNIEFNLQQLQAIAAKYEQDTAVILGKRVSDEGIRYGFVKVILIVRNHKPITIMTRRESQNFDKHNFNVQAIVYL